MENPSDAFVVAHHASISHKVQPSFLKAISGRRPVTYPVLQDVSFDLSVGDHVVVFGEPGSGKTTFLRALAGVVQLSEGTLRVNGKPAYGQAELAAGYVSLEQHEPAQESVNEVLHTFGQTHGISHLPARLGGIVEVLQMRSLLERAAANLSSTERLIVNIARAALSESPLVLLDDTADELGPDVMTRIRSSLFSGRTLMVATRFVLTAEALDLPIMILYKGRLTHYGRREDIASDVGCRRVLEVWVEGLRYDALRLLRAHRGVEEIRLMPTDRYKGTCMRMTITSSRYLPSVYDVISQLSPLRIEEAPTSLSDILVKLRRTV